MWTYEKKLEYPVKIKTANPNMAKLIISQLGGPDGEMGAATRYLSQRYSAPWAQVKGTLTDIGTEAANLPHFLPSDKQTPPVDLLRKKYYDKADNCTRLTIFRKDW